jgi:hypothetical protein
MDFLHTPMISSTNHVLRTPELLGTIFGVMGKSSNARNAAVCKLWHGLALDSLWRDVDDISPLFSNLAPIKQEGRNYVSHSFSIKCSD